MDFETSLFLSQKEFFIVDLLKELFASEGRIFPALIEGRVWANRWFFNDRNFSHIWIALKEIAVSFGAWKREPAEVCILFILGSIVLGIIGRLGSFELRPGRTTTHFLIFIIRSRLGAYISRLDNFSNIFINGEARVDSRRQHPQRQRQLPRRSVPPR